MHGKNMFLMMLIGLVLLPGVSPGTAQASLATPGAIWTVHETGPSGTWDGVWIVRDDGKTMDASWSGGAITDVIDITSIEGDEIALHRRGNDGYYYGALSSDGLKVSGTASWKPDDTWMASVKPGQSSSGPETGDRNPDPAVPADCNKYGGYWELTSGDIVTVMEDCDPNNYSGNWCGSYDWKGALDDELGGKIKVTEDEKSRWGTSMDWSIEYSVEWKAPPRILIPNKEININLDIIAAKSGFNDNGWPGLAWYSGFDTGSPNKPYSWGVKGSRWSFPETTKTRGPFSGRKTFHWHGDDETSGHTQEMGSMDGIQYNPPGSAGQERSIKMTFPSGPVVVYYYAWKQCQME